MSVCNQPPLQSHKHQITFPGAPLKSGTALHRVRAQLWGCGCGVTPASPSPAVPGPQLTMGIRPRFRVARRRRLMRWKHS